MIPGLTSALFASLILGFSVFAFMVFLPALLGLRKTRSTGSKVTTEDGGAQGSQPWTTMLEEIEEKCVVDQSLLTKVADMVSVLPDLES